MTRCEMAFAKLKWLTSRISSMSAVPSRMAATSIIQACLSRRRALRHVALASRLATHRYSGTRLAAGRRRAQDRGCRWRRVPSAARPAPACPSLVERPRQCRDTNCEPTKKLYAFQFIVFNFRFVLQANWFNVEFERQSTIFGCDWRRAYLDILFVETLDEDEARSKANVRDDDQRRDRHPAANLQCAHRERRPPPFALTLTANGRPTMNIPWIAFVTFHAACSAVIGLPAGACGSALVGASWASASAAVGGFCAPSSGVSSCDEDGGRGGAGAFWYESRQSAESNELTKTFRFVQS